MKDNKYTQDDIDNFFKGKNPSVIQRTNTKVLNEAFEEIMNEANGLDADGNDIQDYDDSGNQINKYKDEDFDDVNIEAEEEIYNALYDAMNAIKKFATEFNADDVAAAESKLFKSVQSPTGQAIISRLIDIIVDAGTNKF